MQTIYELPTTLDADLEALRAQAEAFKAGEISADAFRSQRVPQGVYEQRQDGTFMLRLRLPAGVILPEQMRKAAAMARRFGDGRLHITTRQDLQVHGVGLDGIVPALAELARVGLSTKGGGGNTVRNIMGCPDAGVCAKEVFDVTPNVIALTEFMLPDPVSFQLPRKYKIAFSGCAADCVGAGVNDLGFVAKQETDGARGFAVYAGGGMGSNPQVGQLLEEFISEEDAPLVAEAIKRVFDQHGNRRNKHRARIRFLVNEKGFAAFETLYREELAKLRTQAPSVPARRELSHARLLEGERVAVPEVGFDRWWEANVVPQRQAGTFMVRIPVMLGDLSADVFEKLADVVAAHGEGMLRATPSQNLLLRWLSEEEFIGLHRALSELGLADALAPVQRELIACTGSATCRLGVCLSPGLAKAVHEELNRADMDLAEARDLSLHINGCPNSCGRHPIAAVGLYGKARRVGDRLVPCYVMQLGGQLGEGQTRLAAGKETLPARAIPKFLVEYLSAFRASASYPSFSAYLENGGREEAKAIAARFKDIPSFEEDENFYTDWGAAGLFSLAGLGAGECSAGVFDLIQVDLANARDALSEGRLSSAIVFASRAMLVTQGQEAKDAAEALGLFARHFLDAGHVDASFRPLIEAALARVASQGSLEEGGHDSGRVRALIDAVEKLYASMDQSLRFQSEAAQERPEGAAAQEPRAGQARGATDVAVDREADFQGVTCPLNYVKTKMLLGQMQKGQVLSVLLDEAGARSVPKSAEKDGHEVLLEEAEGQRWRILLRKG